MVVTTDPYRLPTNVSPSHYAIVIEPDLATNTFKGTVTISANVGETTDRIVLNAEALTITRATVTTDMADPASSMVMGVEVDAETERLTLVSPQPISEGDIEISIGWEGQFNEQLVGLYGSTFVGADGTESKLATTQFEATHARKCFPCWDEPSAKATFQLTLVVSPGLEAVSNSCEVARSSTDTGKVRIEFAPTMVMSTYLVAFVVGPLEYSSTVDVDGVDLRIVHTPGKGELTEFALEVGAFALRYFADYFDVAYPADKLDLVAIPDFAFGAMENLGCVTFREVALLTDPSSSSQAELQRVADVINHEIAHMWFGDLVTMEWWNGIWLNEAFATFMEMKATDAFRPEWQRWVDFSLSRTSAFAVDALKSTRPVEFEVVSPEQADDMFDVLTYEKGAAVVRMLEDYVGEQAFQAGIRHYIAANQYANTETTDLWDAIEAQTDAPVRRIMDSWIFQGGFPLISVSTDGRTVTFTQSRMGYQEPDETLWSVPLTYRARLDSSGDITPDASLVTGQLLLDSASATVELPAEPSWVLANAGAIGFMRTAYSPDDLEALAEVSVDELSSVERYSLLDDAYEQLLVGKISAIGLLNLIEAMGGEGDLSVWERIVGALGQLNRLLEGEARDRLADIIHDIVAPPLAGLGLEPLADEDGRSRRLRGLLFKAMGCLANDPEIQQAAQRLVAESLRQPGLVEASLGAASVEIVASIGDEADFDGFCAAWQSAADPQTERRYLYALADFTEPDLIGRLHDMILSGRVRSGDAPYVLGRSLLNREATDLTWAFITTNWTKLNETFPTNSIARMLEGIVAMNSPSGVDRTTKFLEAHGLLGDTSVLRRSLERQRVMSDLRAREQVRLSQMLTT